MCNARGEHVHCIYICMAHARLVSFAAEGFSLRGHGCSTQGYWPYEATGLCLAGSWGTAGAAARLYYSDSALGSCPVTIMMHVDMYTCTTCSVLRIHIVDYVAANVRPEVHRAPKLKL